MKKVVATVAVLAMVVMFSACSMDTIRYAGNTDKFVQTAPCVEVATVAEAAPAIVAAKATKIKIMKPILFDFDKSNIRADQEGIITEIAALMAEYPDTDLVIDAWASKEGPEKYNLKLSQSRANSVKSALVGAGVKADRIVSAVGKGETGVFGEILKLNRRAVVLSVE